MAKQVLQRKKRPGKKNERNSRAINAEFFLHHWINTNAMLINNTYARTQIAENHSRPYTYWNNIQPIANIWKKKNKANMYAINVINLWETKHSLKIHIGRKHASKIFKCNFKDCNRAFGLKSDQLKHIRVHRNKSSCDVCKKKCGTNAKLQEHQKLHAKTKDQSTQDVDTGYGSQIIQL